MIVVDRYYDISASERLIYHSQTHEESLDQTSLPFKKTLTDIILTQNQDKEERDKLPEMKQVKNASTFNNDLQRIIFDFPKSKLRETNTEL